MIHSIMNQCFPTKAVSLSTRDPPWISPLLKYLIKKRAKAVYQGKLSSVEELTKRISKLISENRKYLAKSESIGTSKWWKTVDALSMRRRKPNLVLDKGFLDNLNDYFGNLCSDSKYIQPVPLEIDSNPPYPPQFNVTQVLIALSKIKRIATRSDHLPFWVWRDNADILAPVVARVWNLSLSSCTWPLSWKTAHIDRLPKIENPFEFSDFRGINVTPVIARCFQRIIYCEHSKKSFESNLSSSQF